MKKILACVLALTMVLSLGITAFAVATPAPVLEVAAVLRDDGKVQVSIDIPAKSYLTNGKWLLKYNATTLEYDAAASAAQKEEVESVGTYGVTEAGIVSIGYMIDTRLTKAKSLAVCVFSVIDTNATSADFTLVPDGVKVCDDTDTEGTSAYAVTPANIAKNVVLKAGGTTKLDDAAEKVVKEIEDILAGGKVDTSKLNLGALASAFTNSDIDAILAKLKAGEFGGLTLDQVKAALNSILSQLKGETSSNNTPSSTNKTPSNTKKTETTKKSGDSLSGVGDAGIALAATVCLAAAAAFVMAKKKKD